MTARSAGVLMYRLKPGDGPDRLQVYLAHPGGPFFKKKNEGYWGIPKGLVEGSEDEATAALREFEEETGFPAPEPLHDLGTVTLKSGKVVHAFASRWPDDDDPPKPWSNTFHMEWPPRSGRTVKVPEIDAARFFSLEDARGLINEQQRELLHRLVRAVGENGE